MDVGNDDRESGIEQHLERLLDEMDVEQRRVDQPFLSQQRNPGNHPDDVRGPERDRADQKQADREQLVLNMKDQKISHQKSDDQREQPSQERKFERRHIEMEGLRGSENVDVVRKRKCRQQPTK